MQRDRRRDPYPWTWEIPLGVGVVVVLVMATGVQVARGLANLVVGAGWTWPNRAPSGAAGLIGGPGAGDAGAGHRPGSPLGASFWTSLPKVVSGDAGAGLGPPTPGHLAGPRLLWASLIVTELTVLVLVAAVGIYLLQRWGPGRMRGMATATEAERLLGVTRLRKVSSIVRPDLYGKHTRQASVVAGGPASGLTSWRTGGPTGGLTGRQRVPWLLSPANRARARKVDPTDAAGPPVGRGLSPWLLGGRTSTNTAQEVNAASPPGSSSAGAAHERDHQ